MKKKFSMKKDKAAGLYRIKALRSFGDVKKGQLGGLIEKEANLSHDGDCWVYGDARVSGNALVYGNAQVYEYAWVSGNARVSGNALVYGNAQVYEYAWVSGNALVYGNARVSFDSLIKASTDYICAGPLGSRSDNLTISRSKTGFNAATGCWSGTVEEFLEAVRKRHKNNKHARQYRIFVATCLKLLKIK